MIGFEKKKNTKDYINGACWPLWAFDATIDQTPFYQIPYNTLYPVRRPKILRSHSGERPLSLYILLIFIYI